MDQLFDVDIDTGKIRYEGEWLGREELAGKIKRMIEAQDFRIGGAGAALEHLEQTLKNTRSFEVKLAPREADLLDKHAERAGLQVAIFVRQAIQAYLAAQPPLESADEQPAAITTEPVPPGEEDQAVELTEKKSQSSSKVLVDPSLQQTGEDGSGTYSWFKKNE